MRKKIPWNKGQKMTQTTKERISAALKGKPAWNKGKSWSNSVKKKISKSKRGVTPWNKGRNWPVKVRRKISRAKIFPEAEFKELYDLLETNFNSNYSKIDKWIRNNWNNVPILNCNRGEETLPTHIRHCFHHKKHGVYSKSELRESIKRLSKMAKKPKS